MEIIKSRGVGTMQKEKAKKREYKKKNDFKINLIFNEKGESLEKVIERAFRKLLPENWKRNIKRNNYKWYLMR